MRGRRRGHTNTAQQELPLPKQRRRKRRGRKRNKDRVSHAKREVVKPRFPMHVTVRMLRDLPRLRNFDFMPMLKRSFIAGCDKGGFRIVQFSIQTNHIHLIVEADDNTALARGIQGWAVRIARGLNGKLGRRGTVFADRYHVEIITMPKQMRNAYCYVLQNARHHGIDIGNAWHGLDPFSSGWWFDGWSRDDWRVGMKPPDIRSVVPAKSWLATTGWRRHGELGITESPASHMPRYCRDDDRSANWR